MFQYFCERCQFFELSNNSGDDRGICRLNPPVVVKATDLDAETDQVQRAAEMTYWPVVWGEDDWCGRLKLNPDA